REVLKEALAQAHVARAQIREVMAKAISEPRKDVGKYAPKMDTFYIDADKIRDVIGTGGKVINEIIAKNDNVKIDIEDNGQVTIYHMDRAVINNTKQTILDIVREAKVGEVFEGEVTRIEDYGAFVHLFGNVDGLCHVSSLGWGFINKASDVVKLGDKLKVRVTEIDDKGKVKVSHKEFAEKPENYDPEAEKNARMQHSHKPDNSFKGPKKFKK
ncbi:MAG: S1 RNA-binding domain-containing protein, partial [Bacilli bacterium]|nr:S1 RNA-binding domain-containing protein [Bacilli bacterium]